MTPVPVRLRLSRAKGFDLQAHSRSVNGLEAVNVARPSKWGNPFVANLDRKPGRYLGYVNVGSPEEAVCKFREMIATKDELPAISQLRGKNLACWCKAGSPCHADVLLELASTDAEGYRPEDVERAIRRMG